MDMKEHILAGADHLYLKYGVRSVTMDDIANHLSISKKTIYQHFEDKNDLVMQVTIHHMEGEKSSCCGIMDESTNAIEQMHRITGHMREHVVNMNPSLLFDLKKYHPKAFEQYQKYKFDFLVGVIEDNLKLGIQQGYYRPEINTTIMTRLRIASVELGFDNDIFPPNEFNIVDVQMNIFDHFLHGVMTAEGLKLYKQYLNDENK